MSNFKYKLQRFMYGRYGIDALYRFLLAITFMVMIVNLIWPHVALWISSLVLFVIALFRTFSKNINARRKENQLYLKIRHRLFGFIPRTIKRFKERKIYLYKKCPHCHVTLRLKRIKGSHTVECPKCSQDFTVKVRL